MAYTPESLVPVLLGLHFAAFGWRVNREISVGDTRREAWLLAGDYINLIASFVLVAGCVVAPTVLGHFPDESRAIVTGTSVLIVFYPAILAGHYRLFSRRGRLIYEEGKAPQMTDQEYFLTLAAIIFAGVAAWSVLHAGSP